MESIKFMENRILEKIKLNLRKENSNEMYFYMKYKNTFHRALKN